MSLQWRANAHGNATLTGVDRFGRVVAFVDPKPFGTTTAVVRRGEGDWTPGQSFPTLGEAQAWCEEQRGVEGLAEVTRELLREDT